MKEMMLVAANSHTPTFCLVTPLTYLSSSANSLFRSLKARSIAAWE